jgi:hypothetical protein
MEAENIDGFTSITYNITYATFLLLNEYILILHAKFYSFSLAPHT